MLDFYFYIFAFYISYISVQVYPNGTMDVREMQFGCTVCPAHITELMIKLNEIDIRTRTKVRRHRTISDAVWEQYSSLIVLTGRETFHLWE